MRTSRRIPAILFVLTIVSACTSGFEKKPDASQTEATPSGNEAKKSGIDTSAVTLECPGTAERTERPAQKKGRVEVYCDQAGTAVGPAASVYPSGRVWMEGQYASGKKDGNWVGYFDRKKKTKAAEGEWKEGKRHGAYQKWFGNGKRAMRGRYEEGRKTGEWAKYNKRGQLVWKGDFKEGKRSGEWSFYTNGKMTATTTFDGRKKNGPGKRFHEDGTTVRSEGEWKDGLRVGEWKVYDADGNAVESEMCEPSCKN